MSFEIFLFPCIYLHQLSFLNIHSRIFYKLHTLNVWCFEYALVLNVTGVHGGPVVGGDAALQTGGLQV